MFSDNFRVGKECIGNEWVKQHGMCKASSFIMKDYLLDASMKTGRKSGNLFSKQF